MTVVLELGSWGAVRAARAGERWWQRRAGGGRSGCTGSAGAVQRTAFAASCVSL